MSSITTILPVAGMFYMLFIIVAMLLRKQGGVVKK